MRRRRGNDIGGGLLLILFIVILPIMLIIWLCEKIGQQAKNVQYNSKPRLNNNPINNNKTKKNSNHFKWVDGKTDELDIDEIDDIEELLEDDDLFDN